MTADTLDGAQPHSAAVNGHAMPAVRVVPLPPPPSGPVSPWPRQEKRQRQGVRRWPLLVIASPAAVAIWSGWVALGQLCGFGVVAPLPGIVPWHLDTAITLPVGVEAYGAFALGAWLSPGTPRRARKFARGSAIGALALGACGQVIYHLLAAAHAVRAPWPVVVVVSCMPVVTLGFGAALTHLLRAGDDDTAGDTDSDTEDDTADDNGDDTGDDNGDDTDEEKRDVPPPPEPPLPPRQPKVPQRDKVTAAIKRHPDWTDKRIADSTGVSARTVHRRREKLAGE